MAAAMTAITNPANAAGLRAAGNVVLVHGLFADGSCWSQVVPRLQAVGLNVTSVQNPLTTLEEAVAETRRVLARQDGPTVLVGNSFSGMIVTEAGVDRREMLLHIADRPDFQIAPQARLLYVITSFITYNPVRNP